MIISGISGCILNIWHILEFICNPVPVSHHPTFSPEKPPAFFVCLFASVAYVVNIVGPLSNVRRCELMPCQRPIRAPTPPPRPPVPPEGGALIACADLTFACAALPEASAARQAYNTISTCVPVTLAGRPPKC